jgi:hypothetical protein
MLDDDSRKREEIGDTKMGLTHRFSIWITGELETNRSVKHTTMLANEHNCRSNVARPDPLGALGLFTIHLTCEDIVTARLKLPLLTVFDSGNINGEDVHCE